MYYIMEIATGRIVYTTCIAKRCRATLNKLRPRISYVAVDSSERVLGVVFGPRDVAMNIARGSLE